MRSFAEDVVLVLPFAVGAGMIGRGVWDEYLGKLAGVIGMNLLTVDVVRNAALYLALFMVFSLMIGALFRLMDVVRDSIRAKAGKIAGLGFVVLLVVGAVSLQIIFAIAFVSVWEGG